ncbi:MAG TPA: sigma-54 dependent transcriptional regulator [Candidatus Omnitrophota bacterium]|nr:sigma-54 dependent transcriptional regulator [Candidatus Omnitrophota bacterium]
MANFQSILIVDDDENSLKGLARYLENMEYDVLTASNALQAIDVFRLEKPDLVLSDVKMPGMSGSDLLDKLLEIHPSAKVILMTAYGSVEDAVKAIKKGAFYYLQKPVNLDELELLIKKAFSSKLLEEENRELKRELFAQKFDDGEMVAESSKMKELLKVVDKIAHSQSTVLIEGESGTGKELIAHRIHRLSQRSQNPFIPVHCAALTDTLLTSELFGHEKGAFTGALDRKQGRFERAHQGTLFLDEMGEISKDTQVKLLRVLQEGEFERVGGAKTIKVDVRVVAATNRHLLEEVKAGRFREDLYYRINVIYIKVPPLRERKEDIPPLVHNFIRQFSKANGKKLTGIDKKAMDLLVAYDWPGNIRELKNIIERMIVLSSESVLQSDLVPDDIRSFYPKAAVLDNSAPASLSEVEKDLILRTLKVHHGNKSSAAQALGISRRTLYRKIEEYRIPENS